MSSNKNNGVHIALATCHDKHNFGSMLQAFATQEYLERAGYDVRTIDKTGLVGAIRPGRMDYYRRHVLDLQMYREKAPFFGHRLRQKTSKDFGRKMDLRRQKFDAFSRNRFHLTRKCESFEELREMSREYDAVVVGSDQLWLPVNISGGYYSLSWVDPTVRKISYATSIGLSNLDDYYLACMSDYLSDYHAISVREESAASIVEQAIGLQPAVTCDPTMLLGLDEWLDIADEDYLGVPREPYLLCYFMGDNSWQRACAVEYARANGLKLVAIAHTDTYIPSDDIYADYYPWDAGPAQWLALVEHAEFICTDSFHGTVFANIFGVPFVSFRRHSAKSGQSTNSRIDTLLGILGLDRRICETREAFDRIASESIDFADSGLRLKAYIAKSKAWLADALAFPNRQGIQHVDIRHMEDCCGCSSCANACPVSCIDMAFDSEGCEYPVVDADTCINCGKCISACPIANRKPDQPMPEYRQRAFIAQSTNAMVLRQSTSGGAFTSLASTIIELGGVVFGAGYDREGLAVYDATLNIRHMPVESVDDLRLFRNSKYVQSEIGDTYKTVDSYLKKGRLVLFSGTPCQCEGLLRYFGGVRPQGLLMVDFVCRAIPCRAVFRAYLEWLEQTTGSQAETVLFRDKGRWGYEYSNMRAFDHVEPYTPPESSNQYQPVYSEGVETDPYLRAFFNNLSVRPSCYSCRFKKRYRVTDITMWDCFDAWRYGNDFDDNRGATRLLIQSPLGQDLYYASLGSMRTKEIDADDAVARSREMMCSVDRNSLRTAMFADLDAMSSYDFIEQWFPMSVAIKVKRGTRLILERTGTYSSVKKALWRLRGM